MLTDYAQDEDEKITALRTAMSVPFYEVERYALYISDNKRFAIHQGVKGLDLAGENGVELSAFFNKKIGAGLFGGEGFIMQKVSGHGIMFAEFDGHVVEYELEAGEQIVVDTGHLAAMTASCTMEIKSVPGVKNMLFGGEGVFNTILTGPGKVWLQTMPISNVAGVLSPYFPSSSK